MRAYVPPTRPSARHEGGLASQEVHIMNSTLSTTHRRSRLAALTAGAAALSTAGLMAAPAQAGLVSSLTGTTTTWAPAATAQLHPGVMAFTNGGQCTTNFVFTDDTGAV